jgi:glycosyltransferase involved in cell wall biosynthesis
MRILQISSARTFGGGERHVVDLCRGLQARGHDVFAALRPTSIWQDRLAFLPPENILQVSIRNSFGVLSAMRIAEFARANKIQIVHAHVARDYIPASIACMAAKETKFVITRHVMFPLKPFNRYALKNLAVAIGVSEAVGKNLLRLFPKEKVAVINNGIEIDSPKVNNPTKSRAAFRDLHAIPADALLVGTLGELKELKGQRDFVIAAQEIAKEHPLCRFLVVGEDHTIDKKFRRELKRLVKVFGLQDRFLWLDWLEDTAEFFAAIDIFVSPSHSEGLSLAILEAMAHGKAVVATETEGSQQLFENPEQLVPIKDPLKLARTISRLLENERQRLELGASAKLAAAEKYSLKRMLDSIENLYHKILE